MDGYTHALVPYSIGRLLGRREAEIAALLLGAVIPDGDWVIVLLDRVLSFSVASVHRGITHSIIFGFLSALIALFIFTRKGVRRYFEPGSRTRLTSALRIYFWVSLMLATLVQPALFLLQMSYSTGQPFFILAFPLAFVVYRTYGGLSTLIALILDKLHKLEMGFSSLVFACIGVVFHLFLDYITSGGIPLLFPFSLTRFSAELFFYIDPLFMMTSGVFIIYLLTRIRQSRQVLVTRGSLAVFLCILLVTGGLRFAAVSSVREEFGSNASVYPSGSPLQLIGVEKNQSPNIVHVFGYDMLEKKLTFTKSFDRITVSSNMNSSVPEGLTAETAIREARSLLAVQRFEWLAKVVVINATYDSKSQAWLLEYGDAVRRAEMDNYPGFLRSAARSPFVFGGELRVKVTKSGAELV
ncbi:MAG TPA: hypothetical protein HA257_03295 [Candidatus Methanoperedenaceae archaeon]|nr:hypothetical protein [Candidatus Methanoperedenaceae archaeon]